MQTRAPDSFFICFHSFGLDAKAEASLDAPQSKGPVWMSTTAAAFPSEGSFTQVGLQPVVKPLRRALAQES